MVLLSTLLVLSLLIAVGMGARVMVHNDTGISGNLRLSANAFYLAEAGIEWSKHEISATTSHPPAPANRAQSFAAGTFSVAFVSATAATPLVAKIVVRSTGTAGTATHLLQSQLTKTYDLADGAVALRGNGSRANLNGTGFVISGIDHDPATASAVPDAKPRPGIAVPGDELRRVVVDGLDASQQSNIVGTGGTPAIVRSNDIPGAALAQLANDLCSSAQAIPLAVPADGILSVDSQEWGSRASPQLRCIEGLPGAGDAVRLMGNVTGGGILVVRNAELIASGALHWEGLIIVTGASVGFTVVGPDAKEIYGSLMVNETGAPGSETAILDIRGNVRLLFSRAALNGIAALVPAATLNDAYAYLPSNVTQDYWRMVTPP
jgi:hypothetical protein